MSDTGQTEQNTTAPARPDYAQYVVCAVMVVVGAFLVFNGVTMPGGYAKVDPRLPQRGCVDTLHPLVTRHCEHPHLA